MPDCGSNGTSVPLARVAIRLVGGALPYVTHWSISMVSARKVVLAVRGFCGWQARS